MDTKSIVEIPCEGVRNVFAHKVGFIIETIIPEKYRVYEGNKKGVLTNPTAMCSGPNGILFIADVIK